MERALRIGLALAVVLVALWVPKYLQENPVQPDLERLAGQLEQLHHANDGVRGENQEYRTLVRGLRDDPRVLDRRAREALNMSRADELIIYFTDEDAVSLR